MGRGADKRESRQQGARAAAHTRLGRHHVAHGGHRASAALPTPAHHRQRAARGRLRGTQPFARQSHAPTDKGGVDVVAMHKRARARRQVAPRVRREAQTLARRHQVAHAAASRTCNARRFTEGHTPQVSPGRVCPALGLAGRLAGCWSAEKAAPIEPRASFWHLNGVLTHRMFPAERGRARPASASSCLARAVTSQSASAPSLPLLSGGGGRALGGGSGAPAERSSPSSARRATKELDDKLRRVAARVDKLVQEENRVAATAARMQARALAALNKRIVEDATAAFEEEEDVSAGPEEEARVAARVARRSLNQRARQQAKDALMAEKRAMAGVARFEKLTVARDGDELTVSVAARRHSCVARVLAGRRTVDAVAESAVDATRARAQRQYDARVAIEAARARAAEARLAALTAQQREAAASLAAARSEQALQEERLRVLGLTDARPPSGDLHASTSRAPTTS